MSGGPEIDLGPQSSSDGPWRRRMRLHQSWWRAVRLGVPPGTGPTARSTSRYGNMLDDDAAAAGLNFLSLEARAAFEDRVAATTTGVDVWRTTRNLMASQPMAFNLFGHLNRHLDLATALLHRLIGDEIAEVSSIEIERLSDALGDRTAFDAFATYRRPDGSPGFVAIETKLTEPFSQQDYSWDRYLGHPAFSATVWTTDDPDRLGDRKWSQLWRNHLLARAEAMTHPELCEFTTAEPIVVVVHHPEDPECAAAVDGYRRLLHEPDGCRAIDLGTITNVLDELVGDETNRVWLGAFVDRYVDLDLSEGATA